MALDNDVHEIALEMRQTVDDDVTQQYTTLARNADIVELFEDIGENIVGAGVGCGPSLEKSISCSGSSAIATAATAAAAAAAATAADTADTAAAADTAASAAYCTSFQATNYLENNISSIAENSKYTAIVTTDAITLDSQPHACSIVITAPLLEEPTNSSLQQTFRNETEFHETNILEPCRSTADYETLTVVNNAYNSKRVRNSVDTITPSADAADAADATATPAASSTATQQYEQINNVTNNHQVTSSVNNVTSQPHSVYDAIVDSANNRYAQVDDVIESGRAPVMSDGEENTGSANNHGSDYDVIRNLANRSSNYEYVRKQPSRLCSRDCIRGVLAGGGLVAALVVAFVIGNASKSFLYSPNLNHRSITEDPLSRTFPSRHSQTSQVAQIKFINTIMFEFTGLGQPQRPNITSMSMLGSRLLAHCFRCTQVFVFDTTNQDRLNSLNSLISLQPEMQIQIEPANEVYDMTDIASTQSGYLVYTTQISVTVIAARAKTGGENKAKKPINHPMYLSVFGDVIYVPDIEGRIHRSGDLGFTWTQTQFQQSYGSCVCQALQLTVGDEVGLWLVQIGRLSGYCFSGEQRVFKLDNGIVNSTSILRRFRLPDVLLQKLCLGVDNNLNNNNILEDNKFDNHNDYNNKKYYDSSISSLADICIRFTHDNRGNIFFHESRYRRDIYVMATQDVVESNNNFKWRALFNLPRQFAAYLPWPGIAVDVSRQLLFVDQWISLEDQLELVTVFAINYTSKVGH